MNNVCSIGSVAWTRDDIAAALHEFDALYSQRPIKDNSGGMKSPHMFALWFMCRWLSPQVIIENGIWKGQGTWLFEQACPEARIISIDPNLSYRSYISDKVEYLDQDFSLSDWSGVAAEHSLVFFDDHKNAYTRLQQCRWFGFRHVIFEDNYPPSQGDCYSLKKAFSGSGFVPEKINEPGSAQPGITKRLVRRLASLCDVPVEDIRPECTPPNRHDAELLNRHIRTYYEFPPIYQTETTRWGDRWDKELYPTPNPILLMDDMQEYPVFYEEAAFYTWMCYVELKKQLPEF